MAEREGFEPPVRKTVHLISNQAPSTELGHLSSVQPAQNSWSEVPRQAELLSACPDLLSEEFLKAIEATGIHLRGRLRCHRVPAGENELSVFIDPNVFRRDIPVADAGAVQEEDLPPEFGHRIRCDIEIGAAHGQIPAFRQECDPLAAVAPRRKQAWSQMRGLVQDLQQLSAAGFVEAQQLSLDGNPL